MNLPHVLRLFRVARIAVGILSIGGLVALLSLTLLAPANAHDVVEKVEPADGSTVASVPAAVKLTLSNTPIALGAEVLVKDENGTNQSNGPVVITDNHVDPGRESRCSCRTLHGGMADSVLGFPPHCGELHVHGGQTERPRDTGHAVRPSRARTGNHPRTCSSLAVRRWGGRPRCGRIGDRTARPPEPA